MAVEHNMDVVRNADWMIDLGPGAGPAGGKLVAAGRPEDLAGSDTPTGRALAS